MSMQEAARKAGEALRKFGQAMGALSPYVEKMNQEVKVSGCLHCGKECDPDRGDTYIIFGMDGDYVCSKECEVAHRREIDHFCGVTLQDDALFGAWLGVPEGAVRSDPPKPVPMVEEPEERPKFNRYRALIDAEKD